MNANPARAKEIFVAALKRRPEQWDAYLEEVCAGDARLRQRVHDLLQAHARTGHFLEGPAPALVADFDGPSLSERPGTVIGPYKLLEEIGEGGFGVVFMAEQLHPVRRKVALKVLKPGMDTRPVVARFEAERQALALMDHPNIAHVLDGGETTGGRPFFVMELVRGVPITDYCDQNGLPPRERLGLFVSVCQAVQHAHQKGIIHRDLKPGNVLVTLHDGVPVVKVIDFGIAKALGQQLTDKTLFTSCAQMIGTPLYMSPEQAELSGLDIDTHSDIYSLGVLLYELLTGTTPFDKERVQAAGYDEMRRILREEEPPRPSARISTLGQAAATVSARRQSDPGRLRQLFRGELDWIVMKALEKDRNRRYESASAFAADVQRYLHDEPVLACPPSAWYRFRKFARRNKAGLATAVVAALAALAAVGGLAVSNALIRQEQTLTRGEKARAEEAQKLAEERAEQIRQDLEHLQAANTLLDRGRWEVVNRSSWDDAHAAFTQAIKLRPDHALAWVERGDLYTRLGLCDLAAADYDQEFALPEPHLALRWYQHALLRLHVGDADGYRRARRRIRERFGGTTNLPFACDLVRASALAPDPDDDGTEIVAVAQNIVADFPVSWFGLYLLGLAHYRAGQYEPAARRLRESLAAQTERTTKPIGPSVLAMAYHRLGQATEAQRELREAAQTLDRWAQERYQAPAGRPWVMHHGADGFWPVAWWDWVESWLFYREAKLLIDRTPPPDDPRLHVLRARALAGLRWSARADDEYAAALKLRPDDPAIRLEAHRNRGYSCIGSGRWREAAAEFARASELRPGDVYFWQFRAIAHLAAGDAGAYRQTCAAMAELFEKTDDAHTAGLVVYACALRGDALPDTARLVALARVAAPIYHLGTYVHGAALYRAGRYDEAVRCFEAAAKTYRPRP
jgi:serine/threonine protein kinase/Flp pilus assembly protein TadD